METRIATEPREQRLIIILADISGYTKFMVENHLSAVHGQLVISHLLESLLREVDIPLELQEIEGDALFLYVTRPDDDSEWQHVVEEVRTKLIRFFNAFIQATTGLREMTACKCAICAHADELKLKIIVHSGRAVFHTLGRRQQVSGADVILAHRLLKNSVEGHEYLLLSDSAYRELGSGMGIDFAERQETYENFGIINTHVHFLDGRVDQAREEFYALDPAGERAAIRAYTHSGFGWHVSAAVQQLRRPASRAGFAERVLFLVVSVLIYPFHAVRYPKVVAQKLKERRALRAAPAAGTNREAST